LKKPKVDQNKCEGNQVCIGIAPSVFEMNDENKAYVKDIKGSDEKTIQAAIDGCPTQAISWTED
jgi:ferredoxin